MPSGLCIVYWYRKFDNEDAEISAKKDANMCMVLESLRSLNPIDNNFKNKFLFLWSK